MIYEVCETTVNFINLFECCDWDIHLKKLNQIYQVEYIFLESS